MPAQIGRRLLIFRRIKFAAERLRRIGDPCWRCRDIDQAGRGLCQDRLIGNAEERHPDFGQHLLVTRSPSCHTGKRVVTVPAAKFMKKIRRRASPNRQLDCDKQLVDRQGGREDALKELRRSDPPFPASTTNNDGRIERNHACRKLGRGIRVSKTAADRASVPYRWMSYMPRGLG